jgi:hypothetical protein
LFFLKYKKLVLFKNICSIGACGKTSWGFLAKFCWTSSNLLSYDVGNSLGLGIFSALGVDVE